MAGLLTLQIKALFPPSPAINYCRVDLGTGSLLTVAGTATDSHRLPYSPLLKRHHHKPIGYTGHAVLASHHICVKVTFRFHELEGITSQNQRIIIAD